MCYLSYRPLISWIVMICALLVFVLNAKLTLNIVQVYECCRSDEQHLSSAEPKGSDYCLYSTHTLPFDFSWYMRGAVSALGRRFLFTISSTISIHHHFKWVKMYWLLLEKGTWRFGRAPAPDCLASHACIRVRTLLILRGFVREIYLFFPFQ